MSPQVIKVGETDAIDARGNVQKVVQLTYTVGANGPFTVRGTAEELQNGLLLRKMQDMANSISQLPGQQQ